MKLITLQQMADVLSVSVQTFRREVREKGIPHVMVGKRQRFDPAKVSAYLLATAHQADLVRLKAEKPRKVVAIRSRFAEKVGV